MASYLPHLQGMGDFGSYKAVVRYRREVDEENTVGEAAEERRGHMQAETGLADAR